MAPPWAGQRGRKTQLRSPLSPQKFGISKQSSWDGLRNLWLSWSQISTELLQEEQCSSGVKQDKFLEYSWIVPSFSPSWMLESSWKGVEGGMASNPTHPRSSEVETTPEWRGKRCREQHQWGQGDFLVSMRTQTFGKAKIYPGDRASQILPGGEAGDAVGAFLVPFIPLESVDAEPGFQWSEAPQRGGSAPPRQRFLTPGASRMGLPNPPAAHP